MIIDAHTHIGHAGGHDWGPQELIASMDEAGIAYSLLISADVTNAPLTKILEVTRNQPRLKAIGHVCYASFDSTQEAMLIDLLAKREIYGIKIYPGYADYYPYDKKFHTLFSYCEERGHPVIVHTGLLLTGMHGYVEQAHPLHVDRIAHDFPRLKILMAHMGYPWLVDTTAVMWKNPNVYADVSAFFDEFVPITESEVQFFIKKMGEVRELLGNFRRFLFATDWPLYTQKEYVSAVDRLGLAGEEKELVMWKNAAELFGIEAK